MKSERYFIIDFSGSLRINPEDIQFCHCETNDIIDGNSYLKLSQDERYDYVIVSLIDCINSSTKLDYNNIEIIALDRYEDGVCVFL